MRVRTSRPSTRRRSRARFPQVGHEAELEIPPHGGFDDGAGPPDQQVVDRRDSIIVDEEAAVALQVAPEAEGVLPVGRLEAEAILGVGGGRLPILRCEGRAVGGDLTDAIQDADLLVELVNPGGEGGYAVDGGAAAALCPQLWYPADTCNQHDRAHPRGHSSHRKFSALNRLT